MTILTSVIQDTNNPCESLNGRMRLKTDIKESIRNSNCYNIIYRFIILALTLLIDQKTGVSRSTTWSHIPIRRSFTTQPHLVSVHLQNPSSSRSSCYREEIECVQDMSYREEEWESCDNGEKRSPVYVVYDKSWEEEFKVDFFHRRCGCGQFQENGYPCVHALFVLQQKEHAW